MSPATRATKIPAALYQMVGPVGKSGSRLRRASEISLTTPGLDLATRLRVFQRALRSRVERRDALLDIVRAVNATLEPPKIAESIVDRSSTWLPAPCWAVVCTDMSGQLSVLADRGLQAAMAPAVNAIGAWVMARGQEFVTNDLAHDTRVTDSSVPVRGRAGARGAHTRARARGDSRPLLGIESRVLVDRENRDRRPILRAHVAER